MNQLWKFRLLCLTAGLVPCAGLVVSRYLPIGHGPSPAQASTVAAQLPAAFKMPELGKSAAQSSTTLAIEALRTKPFARSPVWAPVAAELHPVTAGTRTSDAVPADSKRKAALDELKAIEVTSILTGRQPLAVIAGKARKVGDEIRGGWKITSIDPATGVVGLEHADYGHEQLQLRRKTIEDSTAGSNGVRPNPAR